MKNFRLCREDYQEIKARLSMRQVAEYYGFPANKSGLCLCPFHRDRNPSMKIYPHDKGYYCFSCGSGGDVVKFVARLFHLDNEAAARRLIADFSLPIKTEGLSYREIREREKMKRSREELKKFYSYAYATLSAYRQLLCEAARDPGSPHFVEAMQELSKVEYRLECLEEHLKEFYADRKAVRWIGEIRDRVIGWHTGVAAGPAIPG